MKLAIIVGTTRENRQTLKQAKWVFNSAVQVEDVEPELIDLADYSMPFFAEPVSPRYNPGRKVDPTAKQWLDKLEAADAYIFVTPEYNHSIPGVLKNALDYIDWQVMRKPAAIVSHGTAGGARAAVHLNEIIVESRAVPIKQSVAFAHMSENIDDEGNMSEELKAAPYSSRTALDGLLTELKWYSDALATARAKS